MDLSKSYEYFQPEKVDARIHIVGCGSVGATIAENLVRLGLTNIALWDMDVVSRMWAAPRWRLWQTSCSSSTPR